MSWFKSFGVIFGGMLLLLLGDFASKAGSIDPTVFRLAGAALIGITPAMFRRFHIKKIS